MVHIRGSSANVRTDSMSQDFQSNEDIMALGAGSAFQSSTELKEAVDDRLQGLLKACLLMTSPRCELIP
eukprot:764504-Hanusia_phi.AAC.2